MDKNLPLWPIWNVTTLKKKKKWGGGGGRDSLTRSAWLLLCVLVFVHTKGSSQSIGKTGAPWVIDRFLLPKVPQSAQKALVKVSIGKTTAPWVTATYLHKRLWSKYSEDWGSLGRSNQSNQWMFYLMFVDSKLCTPELVESYTSKTTFRLFVVQFLSKKSFSVLLQMAAVWNTRRQVPPYSLHWKYI